MNSLFSGELSIAYPPLTEHLFLRLCKTQILRDMTKVEQCWGTVAERWFNSHCYFFVFCTLRKRTNLIQTAIILQIPSVSGTGLSHVANPPSVHV